jgi:predicted PurR-regulated permease PerM
MSHRKISISASNLGLLLATAFIILLLWQLKSLLVVLMISIIIASTLAPIIDRGENLKIPRWLAVILVYLGLISILTVVALIIGPTVIQQLEKLFRTLPSYLAILKQMTANFVVSFGINQPTLLEKINQMFDIQGLTGWLFKSSQEVLIRSYGLTRGIIGGVFTVILSLLFSGYMLSDSNNLINGLVNLFPYPWNEKLKQQVKPVSQKMGGYIQGRILVSAILGIAITISLKFLGFSELALGLGVIAGFTNLIPFFGPVLGSIPALLVAIAQGGWTFLSVLLLFVIIQNIETYVLDPLLVGSSVKMNPLYQLLAVLGGAQLLGILWALILPPWIAGASVLLNNLYLQPKLLAENLAQENNS